MTEQRSGITTESDRWSYLWPAIRAILVSIIASLLLIANPLATRAEELPDLVPTAFSGPGTAIGTGQAIPLSWTVENQGTGDAGTYWYDFVYLSTDNLLDEQDPRVGFFPQQRTVAAGSSYDASKSVQAPFAQGTYYLILQTNAWSLISEADHDNNVIVFGPIYVGNKPPTADAGGPYDVPEGGSVALSGSGSDPDGDPLTYAWDIDNDGSFETADQNPTFSATGRDGPGSQIVVLQVCDDKGACAASDTSVNITNAAPAVGLITAPLDPVQVNTTVGVSANFTDPGVLDTHSAVWDWGDGSMSPGTVDETAGSGAATGSHDYTTAGVYGLTLTVTDKDGGSGQSVFEYVVVYDASAGFVTGAGLIDSPAGAYTPDPSLAGKATFGFVARYQQGATAPSGATQFRFQMAGLSFSSTSYQWLVVSGPKAQFKGSGTINGNGDYGFLLTATDGQVNGGGGVDKFRIKIWDKLTDEVIYDNQMGAGDTADPATALVGGNIIIHDG